MYPFWLGFPLFNEDQLDIPEGCSHHSFSACAMNSDRCPRELRRRQAPTGSVLSALYDPFTGNAFGYGDVGPPG